MSTCKLTRTGIERIILAPHFSSQTETFGNDVSGNVNLIAVAGHLKKIDQDFQVILKHSLQKY